MYFSQLANKKRPFILSYKRKVGNGLVGGALAIPLQTILSMVACEQR